MNEKTEIFCQNCQEKREIKNNHCTACGEQICGRCGCTDSEACLETCWWVAPGVCSNCDQEQ